MIARQFPESVGKPDEWIWDKKSNAEKDKEGACLMQFVKLQLGCLLVMDYIEITYIVDTLRGKIPCNRFFDALMVVSPWAVFFDGFTAWTVNHMDIVPAFLNRGAHLLFFLWILRLS